MMLNAIGSTLQAPLAPFAPFAPGAQMGGTPTLMAVVIQAPIDTFEEASGHDCQGEDLPMMGDSLMNPMMMNPMMMQMAMQMMEMLPMLAMLSSMFGSLTGQDAVSSQAVSFQGGCCPATKPAASSATRAMNPTATVAALASIPQTTDVERLVENPKVFGAGAGMPGLSAWSRESDFQKTLENRFALPFDQIRDRYAIAKGYNANDAEVRQVSAASIYMQMQVESRNGKIALDGVDAGQMGGRGKLIGLGVPVVGPAGANVAFDQSKPGSADQMSLYNAYTAMWQADSSAFDSRVKQSLAQPALSYAPPSPLQVPSAFASLQRAAVVESAQHSLQARQHLNAIDASGNAPYYMRHAG